MKQILLISVCILSAMSTLPPAKMTQDSTEEKEKCYRYIIKITEDLAEIMSCVATHNIPVLVLKTIGVLKESYEAIKCYKDSYSELKTSMTLKISSLSDDTKLCYLRALQKLTSDKEELLSNIMTKNRDDIRVFIKGAIETVTDAYNSC